MTSDGLKDVRPARAAHSTSGTRATSPQDAREGSVHFAATYGIELPQLEQANRLLVAQVLDAYGLRCGGGHEGAQDWVREKGVRREGHVEGECESEVCSGSGRWESWRWRVWRGG